MRDVLILALLAWWSPCWSLCPLDCVCQLTTTNCSMGHLRTVPVNIDPNVEVLDLSFNEIVDLDIPDDLQFLQKINLSGNSLSSATFPALINLQEIDLSNNNISLNQISVSRLKNLKMLNLAQNKKIGYLKGLKSRSLEYLDLSDSNIVAFDKDFQKDLPQIQTLILRNNPFRTLANLECNTLFNLDLRGGEVSHIHSEILNKLPNLLFLDASCNPKLRLSLHPNECHHLEIANFSETGQSQIEINSLCHLEHVDFSFNSIMDIEELSFSQQQQLVHLNLSNNNIERIHPKAFATNKNLKFLDLSKNNLKKGDWTQYLANLLSLNLSRNSVNELEDFQMQELLHLYIDRNEVSAIDRVDFTVNLPKLKYLDMSHNPLDYIPKIESTTIETLNLSFCQVQSIAKNAFIELRELRFLDLRGNKLISINYKVFLNAPNLKDINLGHNSLSCNCDSELFHNLYIYLLVNNSLSNGNDLMCVDRPNLTWHEGCWSTWKASKSSSLETFLAVVCFFTLCIIGMGIVIFLKHRRAKRALDPRTVPTEEPVVVRQSYNQVRRTLSEANMPSRSEQERASAIPPPSYEEALLLPPLSEVERMTRSMDVLVERRLTIPATPD